MLFFPFIGFVFRFVLSLKTYLCNVEHIVSVFRNKTPEEDFSVAVTYKDIKDKGYSLSAGQYFDVKINYVDITEEQFNSQISELTSALEISFAEGRDLEARIIAKTKSLTFKQPEI